MAAAAFDFGALLEPVSPTEPCGPDLDLAGDLDYQQVVATTEGQLPAQFLERTDSGSYEVKKVDIDFAACFKSLGGFIEQSRDLRLLSIYARLLAVQRDLDGFATCLGGMATLLRERWDDVHPQGEDGDFSFRIAALQALDDMATVVLPLQHTTLVSHPRLRGISYRNFLLARGEAEPREGEAAPDEAALGRALSEVDLDDLRAARERLVSLNDAAAAIQSVSAERTDQQQAVNLERLPALLASMLAAIHPIVVSRDPAAVPADAPASHDVAAPGVGTVPGGGPRAPAAALTSMDAAAAALAAATRYLERAEPSSPVIPLARQAQQLVGKSFVDVMRILIPDRAEDTKVAIGPDRAVVLTFGQLATASGASIESEAEPDAEEADEPSDDPPLDPIDEAAEREEPVTQAASSAFDVRTRAEAIALLRQSASYFRSTEPSSPIPLLIDRACGLAERDFLAILKELLPNVAEPG